MGPRRHHFLLTIFAVLTMLGGAGCGLLHAPIHHAIKADYDVAVSDPHLRTLTDVTASTDLVASGEFKPGTYLIDNVAITFQPDTHFSLELSLPINDPSVISTREAKGFLTATKPLLVNGIPAPTKVILDKGTVSGEVDLIRTLGAFFFDLIQPGEADGDIRDLIKSIQIDEAKLHLREGSKMVMDQKEFHFGPDSTITLSSISVDQHFNYQGIFNANLNFLPGSKWVGEKVDCYFSGGQTDLRFLMTKNGNKMMLALAEEAGHANIISLEDCTFKFGKNKRSSSRSDLCKIDAQELSWAHELGDKQSDLHLLGKMDMQKTQLVLKTEIHQTAAFFPASVPATIGIDINKTGRATHFATEGFARAEAGRIDIAKKATKLSLWLADAVVGPISFDKFGGLEFKLVNGIARLKQLDWQGTTAKFTLATAGNSTISLPDGMLLEQEQSKQTPRTHLELPLSIKLGAATLKGPEHDVKLSDLKGTINIDVGAEVQLASDLSFGIPDTSLLGGEQAEVQATGLNLSVVKGKTHLKLARCSITIPQDALEAAIRKRVPTSFTVPVKKAFFKEEKWRYRNATTTEVRVNNLDVQQMEAKANNTISFNAAADVAVDGTIEKTELFKKELVDTWQVCPWTLSGRVESDGLLKYKFLSKPACSDSQIEYTLSMNIPIPHDVELDWSRVSKGLMKVIEKSVIVRRVREKSVPVSVTRRVKLFSEGDHSIWDHFGINDFELKSEKNGCLVQFSASAQL